MKKITCLEISFSPIGQLVPRYALVPKEVLAGLYALAELADLDVGLCTG